MYPPPSEDFCAASKILSAAGETRQSFSWETAAQAEAVLLADTPGAPKENLPVKTGGHSSKKAIYLKTPQVIGKKKNEDPKTVRPRYDIPWQLITTGGGLAAISQGESVTIGSSWLQESATSRNLKANTSNKFMIHGWVFPPKLLMVSEHWFS